jgi:hypothetical protein
MGTRWLGWVRHRPSGGDGRGPKWAGPVHLRVGPAWGRGWGPVAAEELVAPAGGQ